MLILRFLWSLSSLDNYDSVVMDAVMTKLKSTRSVSTSLQPRSSLTVGQEPHLDIVVVSCDAFDDVVVTT